MSGNLPSGLSGAALFHVGAISGRFGCPTCNTEWHHEPRGIKECAQCHRDLCPNCKAVPCSGEGCKAVLCEDCIETAPTLVDNEDSICPQCARPEVETVLHSVVLRRVA